MKCYNCQSDNSSNSSFCLVCGASLTTDRQSIYKEITIGRDHDNMITIDDPHVSHHHAVIRMRGSEYILEDLQSTNGTYVNGNRVTISRISKRDQITLGKNIVLEWHQIENCIPTSLPPDVSRASYRQPIEPLPEKGERSQEPQKSVKVPSDEIKNPKEQLKQKDEPQKAQNVHLGLGNELVYAMEMHKSYVGKSFLTLAAYYFGFWVVGAVMNFVFLSQAKRTKQIIGRNPSGRGCLIVLIITHFALPIVVALLAVAFGISIFRHLF